MAILDILTFPDPRLRTKAAPVTRFDQSLCRIVRDMFDTMYDAKGIGLAATQVDIHSQIIVIDLDKNHSQQYVLVNPELLHATGEQVYEEGCLSVPTVTDDVVRAATIRVRAYDVMGQPYELVAEELLAVCIQHEMDHLQGKVFVDYLSQLKQTRIKTKMLKRKREE